MWSFSRKQQKAQGLPTMTTSFLRLQFKLHPKTSFSGMPGTGTYGLDWKDHIYKNEIVTAIQLLPGIR